MSGIIESPPTYYFDGITFNPNFYTTSASGDYITKSTGKKYFLSYPIAQGTQTVSTLNATSLVAASALTCTTQTATDLISANGGITIPSGKTLTVVGTQTSTGLITANGGIRTSTINTAANGSMAIGASSTNGITIGAGNVATSIAGSLDVAGQIDATNGLAIGNGYGLTLSSTAYTPTSAQLGYTLYNESQVEVPVNATSRVIDTLTNLPIGVYHVTCFCTLYTFSIGATQVITMTESSTGGIAPSPSIPKTIINGVATTFQTTAQLGGIVRATTTTNTVSFNIVMTSGGGNCRMSNYGYYAIKIA